MVLPFKMLMSLYIQFTITIFWKLNVITLYKCGKHHMLAFKNTFNVTIPLLYFNANSHHFSLGLLLCLLTGSTISSLLHIHPILQNAAKVNFLKHNSLYVIPMQMSFSGLFRIKSRIFVMLYKELYCLYVCYTNSIACLTN